MTSNTIIAGNWEGYFEYGFEYGPGVAGKRVIFKLTLQDRGNGQFGGECIEVEGLGMNSEKAIITGFLEASFISFTKEYSTYYQIDENGKELKAPAHQQPIINYLGNYNWDKKSFEGKWEILMTHEDDRYGNFANAGSGTWKMHFVS